MLIECGYCGAPLDAKATASVTRCRYCGKSSRIAALRTLEPETPPDWKPPAVWRPPPHVPAPSTVELMYRDSRGGRVGVFIVVLCVVGGVVAIVAARGRGIPGLTGGDPAKLAKLTLLESPKELQGKVAGKWNESARWVVVDMPRPFLNAVFTYWGENRSRPSGVTLNYAGSGGCGEEHEELRKRLAATLGPRFDGTNWRWGNVGVSLDDKCRTFIVSSEVGKEGDELAREQIQVLWKLVCRELFNVKLELDDVAIRGLLGRGYEGKEVATALAGTTIDDARAKLGKTLPGVVFSTPSGLEASIPLANRELGAVNVAWANHKAGLLKSVYLRAASGKKLADPIALAKCLAKETGGSAEVREDDYAAKKSTAYLTIGGTNGSVGEAWVNIYSSEGAIPDATVMSILVAADACDGR